MGKSFIECGAIGFVGADHAEEPIVSDFMGDQALVAGVVAAIEGDHGVFHAIGGIGADNFGVVIHAKIAAIGGDDFGGEGGCLLPSGGVVFLGDGYALHAVPGGFSDAVGWVGGPGEIVDIHGLVSPGFEGAIGGDDDRGLCADGFVFEVGDIELFSQGVGQYLVFVGEGAGGFGDVVVGEGEGDIELAVVAIEFLFHVLVGLPGKFAVVDADAGVPMHAVEVFVTVVVVHFHSSADATAVEVGGKIDMKGDGIAGFQWFGQFDFEEGILDFEGGAGGLVWGFFLDGFFFGVDLDAVDNGTEFLGFVFAVFYFGAVFFVEFIGEGAGLHGILVEVEIGLGEGVGGVVGIDEGFLSVYQLILVVQYRINRIMHILLPVALVGFFVFPVVWVAG